MDYPTFRETLCNLSSIIDAQPVPSAHKNRKKDQPPADANSSEWWLSDDKKEAALTARTHAFLTTYVAAFGMCFRARGGRLSDGSFVHWDKGIFKKLLKEEIIELKDGVFTFSTQGLEFMRPSE